MPDNRNPEQLRALYPHLDPNTGVAGDRQRLRDSITQKSLQSAAVQTEFLRANADALLDMASALATCFAAGGRLLCLGNGGSSCDAAHLAVEFNHPVTAGRPALPALNLCADTAMLTAIGNDIGIEHVFLRQVIAHGQAGDALFALSTSGNSANLLLALREARARQLVTMALVGGDGGDIAAGDVADHCLVVATDSVHRIQESHVITYHILWDLVHTLLAERR